MAPVPETPTDSGSNAGIQKAMRIDAGDRDAEKKDSTVDNAGVDNWGTLLGGKIVEGHPEFARVLSVYYKRLFPFAKYYQWLNYGGQTTDNGDSVFSHREFSFTKEGDIYTRYKSFNDATEMRDAIIELNPFKIDLGAIFTQPPSMKYTIQPGAFYPVQRELVFDIDMTDYDEVRTCCEGATVCKKCWNFMTLALTILDEGLEQDFGFKNRLWVYSGRRGIHCWVSDRRARQLSQDGRSAVAEYLHIVRGGEQQKKKVTLTQPLHPHEERSAKHIKDCFVENILKEQGLLDHKKHMDLILELIPVTEVRETVQANWKEGLSSSKKWDLFVAVIEGFASSDKLPKPKRDALKVLPLEIMFQYAYPRLDIHVSKGMNHLLKSPWVVHPKTGRVCVPIDPKSAADFDPTTVPTISDLLQQIEELKSTPGLVDNMDDSEEGQKLWEKTDLKPYVENFNRFLRGCAASQKGFKAEDLDNRDRKAAMDVDF
eukprot:Clim_evm18s128 gene=Clim_evmTU18s128